MSTRNNYGALDYFKVLAAFLVVMVHTDPLLSYSIYGNLILTRIIARIAVPFFFIVTGFFLASKLKDSKKGVINNYIKKIGIIYLINIIIYIPFNIYGGYFSRNTIYKFILDIFINGTFYHLWYLPALMLGIYITYFLYSKFKIKYTIIITLLLYMVGLFGDNYYGLIENNKVVETLYSYIFNFVDYTRNGIFFTPIFIALGFFLSNNIDKLRNMKYKKIYLIISFILLIVEGIITHKFNLVRYDSMYIILIPTIYFLFINLLSIKCKSNKNLRNISMYIYILHPIVIILLQNIAKHINGLKLIISNSVILFILVFSITYLVSWIFTTVKIGKKHSLNKIRTWAEIDLDNLEHNIHEFKKIIAESTDIMTVVKANAYGHGYAKICERLSKIGIKYYAVAELIEAIKLRKSGIKGEILVLGYTMITKDTIDLVKKHNITLTVISKEHAYEINTYGKKIHVHIKIDTGMRRMGLDFHDTLSIAEIYTYKNIIVKGIYSHLSVSDSLNESDVEFTNNQIQSFKNTINNLKDMNIDVGKIHIHSTYGVLNYYDKDFDIVRIGIGMYGVLSNSVETKTILDLRPILSLKSRIVLIREVESGESVSYSRNYITTKPSKLAVVPIGYADGYPRNLSNIDMHVIVNGNKANIVGNICMDQLIIDITDIDNVNLDDIVTLIGKDSDENIDLTYLSEKSNTISNEILSRLGQRIIIIYK